MQSEPTLKNDENLETSKDANSNGSSLLGDCKSCQEYAELDPSGQYCHKCFALLLNEINKANRELQIERVHLFAATLFLALFCICCGPSMPIYINALIIVVICILDTWRKKLTFMKYRIKDNSKEMIKEDQSNRKS